ncbi:45730_t:CDS:10, partial [Gigaspora margarita]
MNINAPAFVPQNVPSRTNSSSPIVSRAQILHQPDIKRSVSKNQSYHAQGDQNVRSSMNNNNKRNSNPHRRQKRNETNKTEEFQVSITNTVSAFDDMSLNDTNPVSYGAPNKRGQISLNHLLNFSFPPRQRSVSSTPRRHKAINYQPFNKERFVNANFRFLVNSMGDYSVYNFDPDLLLQWESIEQVVITTPTTPSCPICLQKPTAARVTKCGHTYCLSCILHYLMLIDEKDRPNKKWRKCPICWDAVYAKDLKSVRFWSVRNIGKIEDGEAAKGDEMITMRLIQRNANSTIALPRSSTWILRDGTLSNFSAPWHFIPDVLIFSKLMLASLEYMEKEYNRDLEDLQNMLQDVKNWNSDDEIPFIEMAIVNVKEHLEIFQKLSSNDIIQAEWRARELINKVELNRLLADQSNETSSDSKHKQLGDQTLHDTTIIKTDPITSISSDKITSSESSSDSGSSPPAFLPNEFREQSHIANVPQSTPESRSKVKVLQPVTYSDCTYYFYQSEDGQHVYLHPLDIRILKQEFGTYEQFPNEISVRIVNVDLKGVVSDSTLQIFENELQQRRNRRKEKARKEEKAAHKERHYKNTQEILNSDSFFQQNVFGETSHSNSTIPQLSIEMDFGNSHINNNLSTSSNGPKTVWGTPAVSFANVASRKNLAKHEEAFVDNGWDFKEEEVYV